jgi:trehalose 6-phosphate synthase
MRRAFRFIVAVVVGLALLTWAASVVVERTTRSWFAKDIALRTALAVNGSRAALVESWSAAERGPLTDVLTAITHDERIMAAGACRSDLALLSRTGDFPQGLDCKGIDARLAPVDGAAGGSAAQRSAVLSLPGGNVQLSAHPVSDGERELGFVVLLHDLSFVERREAKTRQFLLIAFGFLAAAASGVTYLAARAAWRGWSEEMRRLLQGGAQRPEFVPILRDVHELVDRLVAERENDGDGKGGWTPQRLKQTLQRHLHGERLIIVANREPYIHEQTEDGKVNVLHPASGLVTALEPVMRACSGAWIAHGSGSADRQTADARGRVLVPPGEESYTLRRVWLTEPEEKGYYYGFANEGLWPLCHLAHAGPVFRSDDWSHYRAVNAKFADAVRDEVDSEDPIVLVQDYHFALAPQLVRERLPRATVIMFWHIPWPNAERFGICPWGNELLEGMLGASILGFHTQAHCNNFLDSVDRYLEARIDREHNAVIRNGKSTLVRPYPISIEWPNRWLDALPPAAECREQLLAELGLPHDVLLGVGVDRLDYTKGVEERLLAVERLLERFPQFRGSVVFAQLAAPSRTVIERYRQLNESVEALSARINERFGRGRYRPIVLLRAHHEPNAVFRWYRAADVCYVSSLDDGMNLVAKEFVAARDDERGVLVLSRFTGSARELTEALVVNPYDLDEASAALARALSMTPAEQRDRMRAMRSLIAEFNVYRWAGRMLADAARVRGRDRLSGRLQAFSSRAAAV